MTFLIYTGYRVTRTNRDPDYDYWDTVLSFVPIVSAVSQVNGEGSALLRESESESYRIAAPDGAHLIQLPDGSTSLKVEKPIESNTFTASEAFYLAERQRNGFSFVDAQNSPTAKPFPLDVLFEGHASSSIRPALDRCEAAINASFSPQEPAPPTSPDLEPSFNALLDAVRSVKYPTFDDLRVIERTKGIYAFFEACVADWPRAKRDRPPGSTTCTLQIPHDLRCFQPTQGDASA